MRYGTSGKVDGVVSSESEACERHHRADRTCTRRRVDDSYGSRIGWRDWRVGAGERLNLRSSERADEARHGNAVCALKTHHGLVCEPAKKSGRDMEKIPTTHEECLEYGHLASGKHIKLADVEILRNDSARRSGHLRMSCMADKKNTKKETYFCKESFDFHNIIFWSGPVCELRSVAPQLARRPR